MSQNLINVLTFSQLAKIHDSEFLVVLIPGNNDRQKEFLKQMNIKYVDLDLEFSKYVEDYRKDLYWRKDGHWNIKGNHLAGYIVSKYIIENNLLGERDDNLVKELNKAINKEFYLEK